MREKIGQNNSQKIPILWSFIKYIQGYTHVIDIEKQSIHGRIAVLSRSDNLNTRPHFQQSIKNCWLERCVIFSMMELSSNKKWNQRELKLIKVVALLFLYLLATHPSNS